MSNLENTEEQILVGPENIDFNAEGDETSECYAVQPISLDAICDVAEELGMETEFYERGHGSIRDPGFNDYVNLQYYDSTIDGEDQWVSDWFELYEGNFGITLWKIARKLKLKIVQDCWIDYHFQQFPDCGLDRTNIGNSYQATNVVNHTLEIIWDTYYGDFEYEREIKNSKQHYKEAKRREIDGYNDDKIVIRRYLNHLQFRGDGAKFREERRQMELDHLMLFEKNNGEEERKHTVEKVINTLTGDAYTAIGNIRSICGLNEARKFLEQQTFMYNSPTTKEKVSS